MFNKATTWLALLPAACIFLCAYSGGGQGAAPRSAKTIRVACVGDSITFGARIERREINSYPSQLALLLGDQWQVRNFGVNGATLLRKGRKPYLQLQAFTDALAFRPHVVIIALGTNDTLPANWRHKDEFVRDYVELIRKFQALDSKPQIWLCYPTPVFPRQGGTTDKVIREEIIPRIDETARVTGLPIIDFHTALRDAKEMFPDTLHPDARGARVMAQTVYSAISGHEPRAP